MLKKKQLKGFLQTRNFEGQKVALFLMYEPVGTQHEVRIVRLIMAFDLASFSEMLVRYAGMSLDRVKPYTMAMAVEGVPPDGDRAAMMFDELAHTIYCGLVSVAEGSVKICQEGTGLAVEASEVVVTFGDAAAVEEVRFPHLGADTTKPEA